MFSWGKRIFLFIAVNALVMVTISILLNVLGVGPYITQYGLDYGSLMAFCLVWGMGGAFISLMLSRVMAKWMMGVQIIDTGTHDPTLQALVQKVHTLSRSAGIRVMPQVGIYNSPDVNAFATGPSKNRSLVAVSTGLLHRMNDDQVEGVLGHEVAHIANGDMVTMTLLQGVVNAFVMFLARVIAFAIANSGRREGESSSGTNPFVVIALEMVLMLFGAIVIAWFSRYREYRADAGGARLAGRDKMTNALKGLQRVYHPELSEQAAPAFQSMQISGKTSGIMALFASHPPLEERIARLETATSL